MAEKVGIVAFAFGVPATILPNRRLAEIATRRSWAWNAPIYTQLDIQVGPGVEVEYTDEVLGGGMPPPTLRIARGAVEWARMHGFTQLWIVAAEPHLWRCWRDLRKAANEIGTPIDICPCRDILDYAEDSWYCNESTQKRTQSREAWEKRERILRWMPFFLYKRIAC